MEHLVKLLRDSYDLQEEKSEESAYWHLQKLRSEIKQLTLTDVVNCVYVVTERDNYGEQLFKGVFANREKAIGYLAEDGLKESNIDEINEIELD